MLRQRAYFKISEYRCYDLLLIQRHYLCPGLDDWGVGGDLKRDTTVAGWYEPREEGLHEGLENLARWIMGAEQLPHARIGPSLSVSVQQ